MVAGTHDDDWRGAAGPKRTALVTRGTDGIGKAIARELALNSMRVIIVGRNVDKGNRAEQELREAAANDEIHFLPSDLSLICDVDRLASQLAARWPILHRVVLCAGIVRGYFSRTSEGIETNFAVNYLSRFVLAQALLPSLIAGGRAEDPARVLVIGGAALDGKINYEDVNFAKRFNTVRVVSQFCEANDVFVVALARRIAARPQSHVTVAALKVGVVRTNIRRQFPLWMKLIVPLLFDPLIARSPKQIADSARRLLLGLDFERVTGAMFLHIRRFKIVEPGRRTSDPSEGRRLWNLSSQLADEARASGECGH
jgi:NAD(P)-dependent dehydrogenase (short-subunit alcohol dehydrogenase family)